MDSDFRSWLGSTELEEVTWVDVKTLHATVPTGLTAGTHSLVVEGPFGRQGQLESAFTVLNKPPGSLTVSVEALPAVVSAGQAVTVTATVANGGSGEVASIAPGEPTVAAPTGVEVVRTSGPVPASIPSLAPGGEGTFSWSFVASAAGTLTFGASVAGRDVLSESPVKADTATAAQVAVQLPAALGATLSAPRLVALGMEFEVSMVVTNAGEAEAERVVPGPLDLAPGSVPATLESGPFPPSETIPGGEARPFTWRYRASDSVGALRLSGGAAGLDGNGGWPVAAPAAMTEEVTVGRAALLGALSVSPSRVPLGGTLVLQLQITNPGSASAVDVTPGVPAVDGTGLLDPAVVGPIPASISSLAPGASGSFTWSYTARRAGSLGFSVTATGTDAASGSALVATASMQNAATISGGASLAVIRFAASPSAGTAGVPVTFTLDLANTGSDAATIGAVTPLASPAASASCVTPAPATPIALAAGGTATFTWTCTATMAGDYLLGVAVAATETGTGVDLGLSAPSLSVPVSNATALTVGSFTLGRSTANVGQAVAATLQLSNPTATSATVTAVSPASSPTTSVTCTAAAPAPPWTVVVEGGSTVTWSCAAAAAGTYVLGGAVAARYVSGADASPSLTGIPILVQVPATLAATTFAANPATIPLGASTTVTLLLSNGGGASLNVTAVAPSISPSNRGTCTAATPAPPRVIAGGASLTFTWACTGTQRRTYTLDGTVTATDDNSGASVAPNLPALTLVVQ